MKKSNRLSLFYVLSSVSLLLVLLAGGIYGIYVSIGLSFVRSSVSNFGETGGISNVSYGGTASFQSSMTGVIILSIVLILISIFDFVTLIKQVTFFKQYDLIKNSTIEKKIETKVKSKSSVIFWTILIDFASLVAGLAGIVVNNRSVIGARNITWILYLIDALVSIFAVVSFVLLLAKLKNKQKSKSMHLKNKFVGSKENENAEHLEEYETDIDQIEYDLMKLSLLKKNKMITEDEFNKLRKKVIPKTSKNKRKTNN